MNVRGDPMPSTWVEGGIFQGTGDFSVIYGTYQQTDAKGCIAKHVVYTDTVSQYTGLNDKNGKQIFEGDIVTIPGSKKQGLPAVVVYWKPDAQFVIQRTGFNNIALTNAVEIIEVIGNRWDNPELLGDSMKEASDNASI